MNVLVTGGAGFIGSHLCDKLLLLGFRVICVDNLDPYYSPNVKTRNIQHNMDNSLYKFYEADISNVDFLEKIIRTNQIQIIIHLAARVGVRSSILKPRIYTEVNVTGTLNLLELARSFNIPKFIFASSSSVYGNNKKVPFSEVDKVDNPISVYAATKKAGELYCYSYSNLYKINITCLRFFTVYGPRSRPDMVPYLFTSLISEGKPVNMFGDGSSKRDYTFVSDIVDGIVAAIEKDFKYEIINLGNSSPVVLSDFITLIEDALQRKAEIKQLPMQQGDVKTTYADISKAKKLLGYNPKVNVKEGISRLVDWYNSEI